MYINTRDGIITFGHRGIPKLHILKPKRREVVMPKWIEHIDDGHGAPMCSKNKTNREIVNCLFTDVDPDVVCRECKKVLAKMVIEDFGTFRNLYENEKNYE